MTVRFEVGARNGYHAVDEYRGEICARTVIAGVSRKIAEHVASEMNYAYKLGRKDLATVVEITVDANWEVDDLTQALQDIVEKEKS